MSKINSKNIQYIFLLILLIFNLLHAYTLPLIDDEAYYWVWSNHLDFGYYDHPPMVAVFIKIGSFFLKNELGVRLISCFSNILFYIIWLKILNPKTINENYLFLGLFGSTAIFNGMSFVATPDVPLLLFGSLFLWRWKCFINKYNALNSIFLGLSMALTMYSKYHGAILIIFTLLPSIPIFYKNKWFYFSILLALILYIPHLVWQYNHNWVSIEYHLFGRNKKEINGFPTAAWLLGLMLIANPLLLYFYGKSLLKKYDSLWIKSLQWISIGTIAFFFLFSFKRIIQPQWNLIVYLAIIPLTYLKYKSLNNKRIILLSYTYLAVLFLLRFLILSPWVIHASPMYKLKEFVVKANKFTNGIAVFERYQKAALFHFYNQKPSISLQVYRHRSSQYDLWNSENLIQGKPITFFGLGNISDKFITDENGDKEYYKFIPSYISYPEIKVEVSPTIIQSKPNQTFDLELNWNHPYKTSIDLNSVANQTIKVLFLRKKNLEPVVLLPVEDKIRIPNNKTVRSNLRITIPQLEPGEYFIYIVLNPCGISGKIISNEITTKIY
ncbi:glycosyltransferase family 39 protein [Apibacter muscae]|uniref:ArnT family glycosyltransferase n=1 Tax=Apibacter muscae TaxID=2509004 RepID=UPI0011ABE82F|nr:glycosyltransferase family 39 protein [Apibacter muscae]TWP29563.1 glycosyltransferase family 39 protein [Apibacter muscae]